jgi:hypothetical protein
LLLHFPSYSHPSMPDKSDVMVQEDMHHAEHGQVGDHIAIHTETYDIDVDALGTNLPKRYYWSPGFIGTVVVSSIPYNDVGIPAHTNRPCASEISQTTWDGSCQRIRWH